ncbi:MAG: hypothetical protein ACP5O6_07660, partial [Candidatus Baltobacteraceae bacterium]
ERLAAATGAHRTATRYPGDYFDLSGVGLTQEDLTDLLAAELVVGTGGSGSRANMESAKSAAADLLSLALLPRGNKSTLHFSPSVVRIAAFLADIGEEAE